MAKKYYITWEPTTAKASKPGEISDLIKSTNASVAKKQKSVPLPTPKAGTTQRLSNAKTVLPSQVKMNDNKASFDIGKIEPTAVKKSEFKLPSFKAQIPDAKMNLNADDSKFEGKTDVEKLSKALENLVAPLANTLPGKIASRGQDVMINTFDKQAGLDKIGATGRGDGKAGYIEDTGNGIANAAGDILGFGSSMLANTGGGTMQGIMSPIGNLAERGTLKGLQAVAPKLPSAVNKVANYVLPTLAREGAEGAVYGGTLGVNDGVEGVAREALKGGIENAVFGLGLKGAGDTFSHVLGKLGKVKVTGDDGVKVNYIKEDGSIGIMNKTTFDKEATPLTVNEGLNTLNQSKVGELPTFNGSFENKVTNDLPTMNKVDTQVDTVKPSVEPVTAKIDEGQANTLPTTDKPVSEPVQGEKPLVQVETNKLAEKKLENVDVSKLSKTDQKLFMLKKAVVEGGVDNLEMPIKKTHGMNKYMKQDFATKLAEGLKTDSETIKIDVENDGKFEIKNDPTVAASLLKDLGFKPKKGVEVNAEAKPEKYRYYLTQRPASLGTHPNGATDLLNFDDKTNVPEIGREAWGYVEYDKPLSDAQIRDYELTKGKGMDLQTFGKKADNPFHEKDVNPFESDEAFDLSVAQDDRRQAFLKNLIESNDAIEFKTNMGNVTVSPSTKGGKYQVTQFSKKGEPLSDYQADNVNDVIDRIFTSDIGKDYEAIPKGGNMNLQTFAGETEVPIPDSIDVPIKFEIHNRKADKATSKFYSNSLKENQFMPDDVKNMLEEHKYLYEKETNEGQLDEAARIIKNNGINEEIKRLMESKGMLDGGDTMEHLLITKELLAEAQKTGDYSKLKRFTEYTQDKITQTAKGLQAVSAWKRMSPEGMLLTAQREIKKAVEELPKNTVKKAKEEIEEATKKATEEGKLPKEIDKIVEQIYKKHDIPTLSDEDTKFIIESMQKADKLTGREKDVEIAKAVQFIADKIPATLSEKIRGLQRISMLLNPKTMIRNVGGNIVMGTAENVKDLPGVMMDKALSKISGVRTTGLPNLKTQGKEMAIGVKNVREDAKLGIDTSPARGQYDLPQGRIFKSETLNKLDSATKHGLQYGDTPFYRAAYQDSLNQQMKLNGVKEPTEDMIKLAKDVAENRTFQNASAIAQGFDGLRKALNGEMLGGKGKFGFGNLLLPFTKTPSNIIDKAIDYSPLSALKLMKQAVDIKKDGLDVFNQKKFVDTFGRGVTGSAIIALGYKLAESGLLTGGADKDYDKAAVDKLSGETPYSFKVGDGYYTFDWMQPSSVPLAIGADIYKNGGTNADLKDTVLNAITSGGETIFDQSLFQSVKKFMGGYGTVPAFGNVLRDAPQQFMPTIGKQVAQVLDPTARSSYDPSGTATSVNKVKAKIPGISSTLQPSVNVLGEETKTYGNSSGIARLANIFLNPGFYTEKTNNPGIELVKKIYDQTGEKVQFPRVADKTITANGNKITLTAEEYTKYQTELGQQTNAYLQTLKDNGDYEGMAKDIQTKITKINTDVKNNILKNRGLPTLKSSSSTKKSSSSTVPSWLR